jgi:hypothetical protein
MAPPPAHLFPRPRHLDVHGEGPPTAVVARPTEQVDASLPAEGFVLELSADRALIRHADDRGLAYARRTLGQIVDQASSASDRLSGMTIRDWPDFPVRGYMLDISRNRVPTRQTLDRIVGLMALARLNHLQLYTEHTFAYRDHGTVWAEASPMTPEDIAWLQQRCAADGIELSANQNTFGHMERWLRHDSYRPRAELPEGRVASDGRFIPPAVLAPTEDNAAFVGGLLDELLALHDSRRVNIGCDETFELGKGVSSADAAERGVTAVYADHVARIARPLTERGYEVLFWADILQKSPSVASVLPEGVVPIVWTYEAPIPEQALTNLPPDIAASIEAAGVDLQAHNGFAPAVDPIASTDLPFWVAPGTSSWNTLVGRIDNAVGNLLDAADVGVDRGAGGYLVTDWGDNGHLQPPSLSWGPLVFGGAVSWCLASNRGLDLPDVLDRWVFADGAGVLGPTLDALGRLWRRTGQKAYNGSPLSAGLLTGAAMVDGEPDAAKVAATIDHLDDALAAIASSSPTCADAPQVRQELTAAARLARHGAYRLLARAHGPAPTPAALRADLTEAVALQEAAWLARSRPGGLADSLARLHKTLATYD